MDKKMQADIDAYLGETWKSMAEDGTKDFLDGLSAKYKRDFSCEIDHFSNAQIVTTAYATLAHERWAEEPGLTGQRREDILEQSKKEVLDLYDQILLENRAE